MLAMGNESLPDMASEESMANNLQTHLMNYPWAEKSSTVEVFAAANRKVISK